MNFIKNNLFFLITFILILCGMFYLVNNIFKGPKREFPESNCILTMDFFLWENGKDFEDIEKIQITYSQVEILSKLFQELPSKYHCIDFEPDIVLLYKVKNDQSFHYSSIFLKEKIIYHENFLTAFNEKMIGDLSYCYILDDSQIQTILEILNKNQSPM